MSKNDPVTLFDAEKRWIIGVVLLLSLSVFLVMQYLREEIREISHDMGNLIFSLKPSLRREYYINNTLYRSKAVL